ncbi:E3 ubiquitin-protein ligase MARCHF3 [Parasteatoda tepidariorum]|uniref:E3 ubiquitin-protein ligase MARCHF3 n=1 Tax=Parasteatoda tepidariorum TaxID=114398 RepID=UPI00077F982F|nr:E3 ubiquitin-protein ligase MARCHF3 isoform X2 [Parasteatoda tepidariorum]XP_015921440.1 E3 ubiquitin-protein ligase MARCHF3 isoform X2 [Parasteatoda tepidariorum]
MAYKAKETNLQPSLSDESLNSPFQQKPESHAFPENQPTCSTTPNDQSPREQTTCLITPNIRIKHLFVYNFPSEIRESSPFDTIVKFPSKLQSPAASSGPICRICHEGDDKEDLVSPCRCTGTVGLVHKKCMERWLSSKCNNTVDKCEICNYPFVTIRKPKSFYEFIQTERHSNAVNRSSFMGDLTCFFLLTPLAFVSGMLCVEGAMKQVLMGNSLEAGCLMGLATFLITSYIIWLVLTVRYHIRCYLKWRTKNHNVKLMKITRISTASDGLNHSCIQIVTQEPNNQPNFVFNPNVVVSIPEAS